MKGTLNTLSLIIMEGNGHGAAYTQVYILNLAQNDFLVINVIETTRFVHGKILRITYEYMYMQEPITGWHWKTTHLVDHCPQF